MSGQVVVEELSSTRQSTDGSITPVSPALANEQPQDENCLLVDSDRIPSHVFAATSTTSPGQWSTASNESLFSIHPTNASFTRDQFNWMSKSADFGFNCDSLNISSPLMELPRNMLSPEITTRNGSFNKGKGEFGASASAAETMREVLRDKECQQKDHVATGLSPHSRSLSTHSDASVKSFAFPINHKDPVEVSGYFSLASHPVVGILHTHKDPVEVWGYSSLALSIFEVFLASA
ncbi:hypothetical protein Golob_008503, partial [Gossypium lobatum]|nr:hypothetical protein [Gossypium lobatum]